MEDELFTESEIEQPTERSRRGARVAVGIALAGVLLVGGAGTAFAIQATQSMVDNLTASDSPSYVPIDQRDDVDVSELVNPTPTTTAAAGLRTNAYGTPLYDVNSDPALITYPSDRTGDLLAVSKLVVAQNFIIAKCMAHLGHDYVFALDWERTPAEVAARGRGFNEGPREGTPAYEALRGTTELGDAYRWEDGGCVGYAVHATGMDGQH